MMPSIIMRQIDAVGQVVRMMMTPLMFGMQYSGRCFSLKRCTSPGEKLIVPRRGSLHLHGMRQTRH